MTYLSRETKLESLKRFKRLRDGLLNADPRQFDNHLVKLLAFCENDQFVRLVLNASLADATPSQFDSWLEAEKHKHRRSREIATWDFPDDTKDEFHYQHELLIRHNVKGKTSFIDIQDSRTRWSENDGSRSLFLDLVARPFCETLGDKLADAIGIPSEEARELDAVPMDLVPPKNSTRIFLCHKSDNKATVRRYHRALQELGFDPWLDDPDMPAGTELDRGILEGVMQSSAVVFFLTEEFIDEKIISDEINYAKRRKRELGNKFALIALKFSDDAQVPELLKNYIYKQIENDLDGLYEIVRALPIELGPVRWKQSAVK